MEPVRKSLKVNQTVDLTPYCWVDEVSETCPVTTCGAGAGDPCFDTTCLQVVRNRYPLTNQKDGFLRFWSVNQDGTVQPKPTSGATYAAPGALPVPDPVKVTFTSASTAHPDQVASPSALVDVTPNGYHFTVGIDGANDEVCALASAASMNDGFSFDWDGTEGEDVGNSFTNAPGSVGGLYGANSCTIALLGAYDFATATRADVLSGPGPGGGQTHVLTIFASQTLDPGCTCTLGDVTETDPGGPATTPAAIFDITFHDSDFNGQSSCTLPLMTINPTTTATVTITQQ